MKQLVRIIALLAAAVLVVSIATAGQNNPLMTPPANRPYVPSPVIYPDQDLPTRFFHDKHIKEEVDCVTCHERAEESVASSDVLVPVGFEGEEVCTNCHDFQEGANAEPVSACTTCHFDSYKPTFPAGAATYDSTKASNKPGTIRIPVPNLKMNHKIHIDKGIECSRCHGTLESVQVATRENALPLMNTCLECHDGKTAPSECRTCHITKPDGRMVNHFQAGLLQPAGNFRNDAHDDNYLKNHGNTAKGEEAYCANCHEPKYCLECHNGVARPVKIHPNNWVLSHPMSARRDSPSCSSCHRAQSFCTDCHKRMKVVYEPEFKSGGAGQGYNQKKFGKFHPPGWVSGVNGEGVGNNIPRGPNHHAFQAQRNIRACAACHTERTCTTCHGETGMGSGVNPHPPAFGKSRKCKALRNNNQRVCTKCHKLAPECN